MASSFAELRAKQGNALEQIQQRVTESQSKGRNPLLDDETFWDIEHVRGPDGVGSAIIRFLPACKGEDLQWVEWEEYQFQGPGGWYINRSRKSLSKNEKDPVFEYNGKFFADKSLSDDERKSRLLGRRKFYVANILVLKDPNKPENEGKVFKWRFGPMIWNMINEQMFPDVKLNPDAVPVNPFDPVDGANFTLRVTTTVIKGKPVPTYVKSSFDAPKPLFDDLLKFDAIWAQQHPLTPLVSEDQYKPYDELLKRFNEVMGINQNFMDSEPQAKQKQHKSEEQPQKSMAEIVDDEIPDFDDDDKSPAASEFASDDNDDWFNSLKNG